jgi:serine phosphatase RsbU (regulator of sigma subunit)
MAELTLKSLLRTKSGDGVPLRTLLDAFEGPLTIEDDRGSLLSGAVHPDGFRALVVHAGAALGCVSGPRRVAEAAAAMLGHLAAKEDERRALAGEVLQLYREVHLIDQLSEDLTALLDVPAACRSALAHARRLIPASSGGILIRHKEGGAFTYGAKFGDDAELFEPDSDFIGAILDRGVAEIVNACEIVDAFAASPLDAPKLRSLIFAPLRAKQSPLGVILLADGAGQAYTAANLKLLNTIALQIAAAIENSLLCAEMVETARYREQLTAIQRELETARAIQHSLVPRTFPPFPERTDFDLHAHMISARHVGGDFFNYFLIDEEHLGLVIGDVSGKGTPSALFMAVTHAHVGTVALRCADPAACMEEVNRILVADKGTSMYATCFYGVLNTRTGELRYCSAGHNPPYRIAAGRATPLDSIGGLPLGLFPGKYESASIRLDPGDCLYLYTDGVSEATNTQMDDFGDDRLMHVLGEAAALSARTLIETVSTRLQAFCADAPQSDDITMVAVRRASRVGI